MERIRSHFQEAADLLNTFLQEEKNITCIHNSGELMLNAIRSGNKIISCGNGGSMCDAMHFAEELTGRFRDARKALPALSISDPSHISCTANDYGWEQVFSRFVEAHGREGDVLLAISTSGNSPNVIRAAEVAKELGVMVVGLTGKDGGKLADLCDEEIRVPHSGYADRIQEIHIKVIHTLIDHIENGL